MKSSNNKVSKKTGIKPALNLLQPSSYTSFRPQFKLPQKPEHQAGNLCLKGLQSVSQQSGDGNCSLAACEETGKE